ncbi:MAG: hypothetical protein AUJ12_10320 [Alphaproteobacteria bacterium CG1_02_46_17]|nr:MAG: hypothetical protein AUJ12_10320 [Alphaproteobacteria bacterium CG1_02_46_17]
MVFVLQTVWYRKSLILGIIILSCLFGYTLAILVKNPYSAKSVFLYPSSGSNFYADISAISKKDIATQIFYGFPKDTQEHFKFLFFMDTSITGKLYNRYSGRSVDYTNRYDPATVLSLYFELLPDPDRNDQLLLTVHAPRPGYALFLSGELIHAYEQKLGKTYHFSTNPKDQRSSSPDFVQIYPAQAETNMMDSVLPIALLAFALIGLIAGSVLAITIERLKLVRLK